MRHVTALCVMLFVTGASPGGVAGDRSQVDHRKTVVAQNYCGLCAETNTSCRLGCNGAGTCIQTCNDRYSDCLRQNFCGHRR